MGASAKSVAGTKVITWEAKTGAQKLVFVAKVCVMVCTFGFVFGGVLVEGMKYE
jgi:hypothetical protein